MNNEWGGEWHIKPKSTFSLTLPSGACVLMFCLLFPIAVVVQFLSQVRLFVTPWTAAYQASLSFIISCSLFKSCPLSQWCHPIILSSVTPFSSCLQSFPASGSFLMNQFFTSSGQSIGASASASVLPVNIQGWFPFGLTGLISLQSKGLSRE